MSKLIGWVLGFTKVGKTIKKVQEFLDGKKQLLTGLAGALPATLMIIQNFQQGGIDYLTHAAHSPEYAAALLGWGLVWNAVKGEKIRDQNDQILDALKPNPVAPTAPAK